MKKTTFLAILLLCFTYSFAWVKTITIKTGGGLFGYSSISEDLTGPPLTTDCTFTLKCWGAGTSSCRFARYDMDNTSIWGCQTIVVNTSEENWWEVLNDDINDRIVLGYTNGTFIRQDVQITNPVTNAFENAVVTWTYSSANDILEMTIYSYNEALSLGVI